MTISYEDRNQLKVFGSGSKSIKQLYGPFRGILFLQRTLQCFMASLYEYGGHDGSESVTTEICMKMARNLFCKLSTLDDPVRKLLTVGAPDCCHITDSYTPPAARDQQDKVR